MPGFNLSAIPELLPELALSALGQICPSVDLFSTAYEDGPKTTGQTIRVPVYGLGTTAGDYDATTNNYETASVADVDGVDLTYGVPVKVTKMVQPIHLANGLELGKLIESMSKEVVIKFLNTRVYPVILNANFDSPAHKVVGAASAFTAKLMAGYQSVDAAGLGWGEYHAGLVSAYYANLLEDSDFKTHTPTEDEMLATGRVRTAFGWDVINVPNLPDNSESLVGFLTDRSGIGIGTAPNQNAPGVGEMLYLYSATRDKRTGITVTWRGHAVPKTNTAFITAEILGAVGKLRSSGLIRLTAS